MVSQNDGYGLRLPPPWISPVAGMPDREVRPVIIVQRRRLLYPTYVQDYLDRVTAADVAAGNTSGLELGVTDGANTFIQDLVNDGLLGVSGGVISQAASVIKASVPMAGARTRLGAMTPLVGSAPTSFNFGDNDYNRKTGLEGNGLDTYLDSNRNNNADPQNSFHLSVYASSASQAATNSLIGARLPNNNESARAIYLTAAPAVTSYANFNGVITAASAFSTGFVGVRRATSTSATLRLAAINTDSTLTSTSVAANSLNISVFARRTGASTLDLYSNARLPFYSIGESLDLAILDARVTALINAYAAAIP
jgi:hypothetical protein